MYWLDNLKTAGTYAQSGDLVEVFKVGSITVQRITLLSSSYEIMAIWQRSLKTNGDWDKPTRLDMIRS